MTESAHILRGLDAARACGHAFGMIMQDAPQERERARLIAAVAAQGDRTAFASLFAFYAPRVKAQAVRFGLTEDAAEDVAQETLLSLWRRADQFDPERGTASAWVFAIAANARLDRLRRDKRSQAQAPLEEGALDVADVEAGADPADAARLSDLVEVLPPDQRRIVHMSFFAGASHGEIAAALAVPLGTVKSRARLALKKLRAAIGEEP